MDLDPPPPLTCVVATCAETKKFYWGHCAQCNAFVNADSGNLVPIASNVTMALQPRGQATHEMHHHIIACKGTCTEKLMKAWYRACLRA